jgi:lysophospholipase L1-like esterase
MGWFWQVPDPVTGWSHLPNSSGRSFNPMYEFDVAVSINSLGLRGPDTLAYEKPDGVYRALVLGDSFIEAIQVEYEETFGQRLAHLMQSQTGQPVEVISAGAGGWGTDQQLLWLREVGVRFQPDLVILAVYPPNDFMNNALPLESANRGAIQKPFFSLEEGELALQFFPFDPANVPPVDSPLLEVQPDPVPPGPLTSLGQWLRPRSALYRYMDPRVRIAAPQFAAWLGRTGLIAPGQETKIVAQGDGYVPIAYNIYRTELDPLWQEAVDLTQALLAEVKATASSMDAQTAAILITAPETVYPEVWDLILTQYPAMQAGTWDLFAPYERAEQALAQAEIPFLNLAPAFRQTGADGPRLHLEDDGHWTPAGHELTARATYNFLAAEGLVPMLAGSAVPVQIPAEGRSWWEWFVLAVLVLLFGSILWGAVKSGPVRWLRQVGAGLATTGELLLYMARRRQFTLLPLVVILLMFAGLLILAQASVVGPFIYTLI